MKNKFKKIVKYIRPIYLIYNILGNFFIKILKIFVNTDDKLILFISYGGKKYDDSPKNLYEAMITDNRFSDFKLVWAFIEPEKFPNINNKIKVDTFKYFKTALSARVWITNSTVERGLNFKGKNTLYVDTWHGTPIKKMGSDLLSNNKSFKLKGKWSLDVMTVQSDYEVEIFSRVFNIRKNRFLRCGLPRNDDLANSNKYNMNQLKNRIGIKNKEKKVILYMPTFREYIKNNNQECVLIPPIDLKKWEKKLGDKYIILFRAHYEVSKSLNIINNNFIIDVTNYPNLNDLMIVSDLLISDYSSVFFDYAIMNKPMFCFTYDYDEYAKNRGMYFDIRNELTGAETEDDLIDLLLNFKIENEIKKVKMFKNKYVNYYGNSTQRVIDFIVNKLEL